MNTPTFGTTLRTARETLRLSLREVEAATGISNAYISQLESDKIRRPSPVFIRKLATLYGVEYEMVMARIYPDTKPLKGYLFPMGKSIKLMEPTAAEEQELMDYLTFIRVRNRRALAADTNRAGGKPAFVGQRLKHNAEMSHGSAANTKQL